MYTCICKYKTTFWCRHLRRTCGTSLLTPPKNNKDDNENPENQQNGNGNVRSGCTVQRGNGNCGFWFELLLFAAFPKVARTTTVTYFLFCCFCIARTLLHTHTHTHKHTHTLFTGITNKFCVLTLCTPNASA